MPTRTRNILGFFFCACAIAIAATSQFAFGVLPCSLCIIQRYVVMTTGICFLFRFNNNSILPLLPLSIGTAFGVYHVSIYLGSIVTCSPFWENIGFLSPLSEIFPSFFAPQGGCADDGAILGIPYPIASLAFMIVMETFVILSSDVFSKTISKAKTSSKAGN